MITDIYRFSFAPSVPFDEVEDTLLLSLLAAECLYGPSQVRLAAAHAADAESRRCAIDASTAVGRDLCCLFTGLVRFEFGANAFTIERLARGAAG